MTRLMITALALLATPAFAHPGDHTQANLLHMLTEPDHLALIALGAAVLALVVYRVRKQP
jgi:hydrogenase/urease accessory protein HupE